jgi:hypothetical protein
MRSGRWNERLPHVPRAALIAVVVLVSACGSTVPLDQQGAQTVQLNDAADTSGAAPRGAEPADAPRPFDDGLDLSLPPPFATDGSASSDEGASVASSTGGPPPAPASDDAASAAARPPAGGAPAAPQGPRPDGSRGQATPPSSGPPPPSSGPPRSSPTASAPQGITDDEITIGFAASRNSNAANEAIGAEGVTTGRTEEYVRIVVEDLNATGGVAGRTVVPVVHVFDATSTATNTEQAQAACSTWTEDNTVFAVASSAQLPDTLRACLEQKGVPLISSGLSASDAQTFQQFPHLIEVSGLRLDRIAATQIPALHAQGYFKPLAPATETKIGLLTYDRPAYQRAVETTVKPALAGLGLQIDEQVAISPGETRADTGPQVAQINNSVLRFRSAGVTHMLILEQDASLAFFFMNSAENQRYRPRYGLHSQNGGQVIAGLVPAGQLSGAVGIGWISLFDIPAADNQDTPGGQRCVEIMKNGGREFADQNAKFVAFNYCDVARYLQDAAAAAPGALTIDTLIRGGESLRNFSAGNTFATSFGPDKHDGAAAYRDTRFFDDCTCFKYTSGPKPTR